MTSQHYCQLRDDQMRSQRVLQQRSQLRLQNSPHSQSPLRSLVSHRNLSTPHHLRLNPHLFQLQLVPQGSPAHGSLPPHSTQVHDLRVDRRLCCLQFQHFPLHPPPYPLQEATDRLRLHFEFAMQEEILGLQAEQYLQHSLAPRMFQQIQIEIRFPIALASSQQQCSLALLQQEPTRPAMPATPPTRQHYSQSQSPQACHSALPVLPCAHLLHQRIESLQFRFEPAQFPLHRLRPPMHFHAMQSHLQRHSREQKFDYSWNQLHLKQPLQPKNNRMYPP